jgi:hypothetical protein
MIVAQAVKKYSVFIESEDSLPCSQEPVTDSYADPDESSAYRPTPSLEDPF